MAYIIFTQGNFDYPETIIQMAEDGDYMLS